MAKGKYKSIATAFMVAEAKKELIKECNNQKLLLYNNTNWVYSQHRECNIALLQTLIHLNTNDYHKVQFKSITKEINKGHDTWFPYSILAVHSDNSVMI